MKKLFVLLLICFSVLACAQEKQPLLGDTEYQREMNAKFKDASKSPLTEKDRKKFKALNFYKFDSTYIVKAKLKITPDEKPFKMETTTDRRPEYVKYGELLFTIKGKACKLNVYQNIEYAKQAGEEDSLFLPFIDETNGDGTYGGGRYADVKLPEDDIMIIDFNKAYNPYCAYNPKYSCPIVPLENSLNVRVEAGVKAYDKH